MQVHRHAQLVMPALGHYRRRRRLRRAFLAMLGHGRRVDRLLVHCALQGCGRQALEQLRRQHAVPATLALGHRRLGLLPQLHASTAIPERGLIHLGHRRIYFVITVTLGPGPLVLEARRISTV